MIALLTALLALVADPDAAALPGCTPENSIRTTVKAIGDELGRFLDRCVTISGPASGIALYSSVEGIYLSQRRRFGVSRSGLRHRIGLYSKDNAIRRKAASISGPSFLTITGRIDTCDRLYAAASEEAGKGTIVMMTGYCHYNSGPVVIASSWSADGAARIDRLYGEGARRRFGSLIEAPTDWPDRARLQGMAETFRKALANGDRTRLAELHDEPDQEVLDYLLEKSDSPFAQLRRDGRARSTLLVDSASLTPRGYRSARREQKVVLCFCRTADCSETWPIWEGDADNAPDKPYACTTIESRSPDERRLIFITSVNGAWLSEPARTAFRRY